MTQFVPGNQVRIDIPDVTDPDHDEYHGKHGTVVETIDDTAGVLTEDPRDNHLYRIEFSDGSKSDFRWRDLRPPIEE